MVETVTPYVKQEVLTREVERQHTIQIRAGQIAFFQLKAASAQTPDEKLAQFVATFLPHSMIAFSRVPQEEILTKEIDEEPMLTFQKGLDSFSSLIMHNQGFVTKTARRFSNKGLPLDDLINEGNIGLMRGIARYDWQHPQQVRLLSYAGHYVIENIQNALDSQSMSTRVPESASLMARKTRTAA